MNREQIEALDRLAEKATPGPWEANDDLLRTSPKAAIPYVPVGRVINTGITYREGKTASYDAPNAGFIAAIRNAWPELRDLALRGLEREWISVSERMPKSGEFVLAFVRDEERTRRIRAFYAEKFSIESGPDDADGWTEYDESKDEYYLPSGWYEANEYEETHWHVSDGTVTYWMPLPAAPKEKP